VDGRQPRLDVLHKDLVQHLCQIRMAVDVRKVGVMSIRNEKPVPVLEDLRHPLFLIDVPHRPDLRRKILEQPVSRNLCRAGQIDQREIQHIRPMNTKADRYRGDACVPAAKAAGFVLNLLPDLIAIRPNPLACVLEVGLLGGAGGFVDELEDQRTANDNARAPREEIVLDKRFKDG
jgi:hypothetical protein